MKAKMFSTSKILLVLLFVFCTSLLVTHCDDDSPSETPGQVETPTFSIAGGNHFGTQSTTITVASPSGSTVIYTTDNSAPTADVSCNATNGTALSSGSSISIPVTTTLRAIGCKVDWTTSSENTATYTIEFITFITAGTFDGDLIAAEGNSLANGILAADSLCMADTNKPAGGNTYKALIVDGTNRVASVTNNAGDGQVDWVLKSNSNYYRSDGTTLIMTTDVNRIHVFLSGDLTNSFGGTYYEYWTGLYSTWIVHPARCINTTSWDTNTTGINGRHGIMTLKNSGAISATDIDCDTTSICLLCVEQ